MMKKNTTEISTEREYDFVCNENASGAVFVMAFMSHSVVVIVVARARTPSRLSAQTKQN